ncbi:hypothetical protein ACG98H_09130 [Corynebacterium sp. L4756]|uniref:hypothetical protein n=1 Tax=unclassified Corynebacterium TaxID=2624378 RepID=UPI00374CA159
MNSFTAHVQRDGNWWVAQLIEDPGVVTQTRRLDQVANAIRDALTLFPELTPSPNDAIIQISIEGEAENQAQSAHTELQRLRKAEEAQLQEINRLAHELADGGYNYRDIAFLLGITYGRVGQLLKKSPSETP